MGNRDGFIIAAEEKMQADRRTRKELAERTGYAEEAINRLFDADNPPKLLDSVVTIAATFGLSLDEVCENIKEDR